MYFTAGTCSMQHKSLNHYLLAPTRPFLVAPLPGDGVLRRYGVSRAFTLCEAANEVDRIKEELDVLPKEMRAHMKYYQALISRQERLVEALQSAVQPQGDGQLLEACLQVCGTMGGGTQSPIIHCVGGSMFKP